ncbi:hypothetical protein BDN71DRAFT_1443635 [Pleurotus eryngii]|uniref:Uncharacterized protein n=1 Tax=Pleurotus eryngii TaxID=5323 RepID=A0A9P6A1Q8_PLEER|nr:hypothetical protein BDN71DRAFT_1443635 [Pleurotus eryngii]
MPYLAPSESPPKSHCTAPGILQPMQETLSLKKQRGTCINFDDLEKIDNARIPAVYVNNDVVTSAMAARLAASMLGHVLFLKNQVPFPVSQLSRMPGGNTTTRAGKLRAELLTSIDTLSSHLITTFTALSTAYALRGCKSTFSPTDIQRHSLAGRTSTTYLSILIGPSIGAARAKVVFGVDGLEVRHWGLRVDQEDEAEESEEEDEEQDSEGDVSEEEELSDEEEPQGSDSDSDSDSVEESDVTTPDLPRRSPSPPSSLVPTIGLKPPSPLSTKVITIHAKRPHAVASPSISFEDEQQALRVAECNLARTLANSSACDDDGGMDMASEMAPTQTHILLRAPRRFSHPAWIPRQNMSRSLDVMVDEFRADSNLPPVSQSSERSHPNASKKNLKSKSRVEGVWIKARKEVDGGDGPESPTSSADVDEMDEMVWWSWDGKIVGFADW